jgi:hypothetical protein
MVDCGPLENSLQFALPVSCPGNGPHICEEAGSPADSAIHPSAFPEKETLSVF